MPAEPPLTSRFFYNKYYLVWMRSNYPAWE